MAKKRLTSNLYYVEDIVYDRETHHWKYINLPDGRLFSHGERRNTPTSITKEDLPEWYLYGRYYKRFGYLNCKDIKDVKYLPIEYPLNHILKDDLVIISYGDPIKPINEEDRLRTQRYTYDEEIWGNDIVTVLKGMKKYGGYNIDPVIEEIWQKIEWLRERETEFVNKVVPNRNTFDKWWKD